jgi:hypothetical protein
LKRKEKNKGMKEILLYANYSSERGIWRLWRIPDVQKQMPLQWSVKDIRLLKGCSRE